MAATPEGNPMFRIASLLLLVPAACASAQEARPAAPAAEGVRYEGKFADGSVVGLSILETELAVATKYGKLTVPLAEVKRIELGFRYPEGVEAKILAAAENLGSGDFKTREAAQKQLVAFGELSIPAVRNAAKSSVVEAARRAEEVMKKLEDVLPKEKLEIRDYDVVVTHTMTIKGTIQTASLKAKTKYFGESPVKLADLRSLRPLGSSATESIALDSNKYAKQGWPNWFDTGIDVGDDTGLEVSATGKIDQWVQSPGQYMSGPNGNGAFVLGPGQVPGQPAQQYKAGALYGRIGEKGAPFLLGENYKQARAPGSGRLFLVIGPSNWNNDSVGEYKVTVKTGE
jgi:hypothetical protein